MINVKKPQLWFAVLGVLVGLFLLNELLTLTYYNPAVMIPVYGWLRDHGVLRSEIDTSSGTETIDNEDYKRVSISALNHSLFWDAHAVVLGTVTGIVRARDGDVHLNLTDDRGNTLVLEMIPERPLSVPEQGARIEVWGITRYDLGHRWWEIHPVLGWKLAE